jgi:hypothetical protein
MKRATCIDVLLRKSQTVFTGLKRAHDTSLQDKPLAEYLKASIKHGNEMVYRPGTQITWDARSILNSYVAKLSQRCNHVQNRYQAN